jgi:ring-1,2-phenylacetyl-CoA epoxidase subunit PaaD
VNMATAIADAPDLPAPLESAGPRPALDAIWGALAEVPDPEVPVVSIVELGILRNVGWRDDRLRIGVTPTYSGCPATAVIETMIRERLAALGVDDLLIASELAPAWSTDWIAPEARGKLAAFGIAPPHVTGARIEVSGISPLRRAASVVACPRCGSMSTQLLSQFGSTACKAQYRCTACLEPFDHFKPH